MSDNDGDFGSFLAGFVIGGLVGAAVALVMAPQSGAETRSKISGRGRDMVDAGEERYHSAVESAEAYAHHVGEQASQVAQDVEEQARIVLDAGRDGTTSKPEDAESAAAEDAGDETAAEN